MDDAAANRGFDTLVLDDGHVDIHMIHHWPDNAIKVATKEPLHMGQWNHVCVTYDGSSKAQGIRIYIDGQPSIAGRPCNSLTATIATPQPFRLGCRSVSLYFNGAFSDFEFFERTLTPGEIQFSSLRRLRPPPRNRRVAQLTRQTKILKQYFASHSPDSPRFIAREALAKLRADKDAYLAKAAMPTVMVLDEMDKPRPTYLLKRGQYDAPDMSQSLEPGVPEFLPPLPAVCRPIAWDWPDGLSIHRIRWSHASK